MVSDGCLLERWWQSLLTRTTTGGPFLVIAVVSQCPSRQRALAHAAVRVRRALAAMAGSAGERPLRGLKAGRELARHRAGRAVSGAAEGRWWRTCQAGSCRNTRLNYSMCIS